jgi:hypothetical protein
MPALPIKSIASSSLEPACRHRHSTSRRTQSPVSDKVASGVGVVCRRIDFSPPVPRVSEILL